MPKNRTKILVTGGAGFVGTNLIKFFLKKTKFKIISLDNYSSGNIKNHINYLKKIVTPTEDETRKHEEYLKPNLKKNYFN